MRRTLFPAALIGAGAGVALAPGAAAVALGATDEAAAVGAADAGAAVTATVGAAVGAALGDGVADEEHAETTNMVAAARESNRARIRTSSCEALPRTEARRSHSEARLSACQSFAAQRDHAGRVTPLWHCFNMATAVADIRISI